MNNMSKPSKLPSLKSFQSSSLNANSKHSKDEKVVKSKYLTYNRYGLPRMNWSNYHRLNVIYSFMDELEYNYPSICTVGVIGHSVEGREMKVLKVSNSNVNNPSVWVDAGIHSREWITPAVATYIANDLVKNFEEQPPSMKNKDWYILPVLNPDGYEYTHTKDRMWRKNRSCYDGECVGVDLNRNFSVGWGMRGSSEVPSHAFFRGSEPFSEPESAALRDFLGALQTTFKVYLTFHSYGRVIIFPFGFSDKLVKDYMNLLEGATIMSKAIHECSGNIYKVGISKDVMYYAAGTSTDWMYGAARIPYCYLLELSSRKFKFLLPKEEIQETCKEILSAVKALMEYVDKQSSKKKNVARETAINLFKVASQNPKSQVWEVKLTREGQRCFVKALDTLGAINIWKECHSTMDVMVPGARASQVAGVLHDQAIPFSVAIGDVAIIQELEKHMMLANCQLNPVKMDWNSYHRLEVIYSFLDELTTNYPYLCRVYIIGKSAEGRDIKMIKISNGDPNNMGVWLDGSIHPREWVSVSVVTYIVDHIIKMYHSHPEYVTNKDWYIVPVLNPDGYEYTHTQDRMWRKNRAKYGECVGVDLNRNFSYGWAEKGEDGSSDDPGSIFYRGPEPFSEPETLAVKNTILELDTPLKVFISFHSYGEVIIFPWGYTSEPCPDYVELLEGGTVIAKAIYECSGRTYRVGSTKDLMYYAAGTSTDWAYAVARVPYAYMVELRGKKHRFLLPGDQISDTAKEVLNGVFKLMQFVDRPDAKAPSCQSSSK